MSRLRIVLALLAVLLVGGAAWLCAWRFDWLPDWSERETGVGPPLVGPDPQYSNILPGDYVGPDKCAECHKTEHARWSKHPHRFMNQFASAASVKGDFSGVVWEPRPGHSVRFHTSEGGDYMMTLTRPWAKKTVYKVTRTVGSRFMQFYIGLQLEGDEPPSDERYTAEHKLPFAYWFRMRRWLPGAYFDAEAGDAPETLKDGLPEVRGLDDKVGILRFDHSCLHCHNTYPHAYRAFRPSIAGFPDAVITPDAGPLSAALSPWLSVRPYRPEIAELPYRFDAKTGLITTGISCESCHMGGREHAQEKKTPSFYPTSPHARVTARREDRAFTGRRDDPATSQGVCAQCHAAAGIGEHPNGARVRNSAESLDMAAGHCSSKITCVACHEPHTPGVPSGGPAVLGHVKACMSCHPKYGTEEKALAHGRHPAGAGLTCLDCHMPRITQGIDEMSRTHRISDPVDGATASQGAPNACNICHLDRSVRWTLDEVRKGWGRAIEPEAGTPAARLDKPAGPMWLRSERMIERMVAVDSYARSPGCAAHTPTILGAMNDPAPVPRAFALIAAERALGRRVGREEIDITAAPPRRAAQIEAMLRGLKK